MAGTWRRARRRLDISESGCRERWRNQTRCGRSDELKCRRGMMRRFGRHKLLAARKGSFATIVSIRRRNTFALLAAVRGFLGELSAAEAVERLQEQENCDDANRNVNAAAHSLLNNTKSSAGAARGSCYLCAAREARMRMPRVEKKPGLTALRSQRIVAMNCDLSFCHLLVPSTSSEKEISKYSVDCVRPSLLTSSDVNRMR